MRPSLQWCIDNFRDLFQNNFESPPPDNTDPGTSPGLADGCAAVNLEQDQACCRRQVANNVIDQYCLDNYPVVRRRARRAFTLPALASLLVSSRQRQVVHPAPCW